MEKFAKQFRSFKSTDQQILDAIKAIFTEAGVSSPDIVLVFAQDGSGPHQSGKLDEVIENIELNTAGILFGHIRASGQLPPNANNQVQNISIKVIREDGSDLITITPSQYAGFDIVGHINELARKYFRPYERTEEIDKLLGDELSEFYRKREEALTRLEDTQQKLIEQQQAYQVELQKQTEEIREKVRQDGETYKANLDKQHTNRVDQLDEREQALDARLKEIDDRDSKHARRKHQEDIKAALKTLDTNFKLSEGTGKKRRGMHLVFALVILFSLGSVIYTIWADQDLSEVATWIKVGLGSVSVVGFATAYLGWMNKWFSQHADEEFRLKRLSLDIDRASWLVETVSEWQSEHPDQPLPPELLQQIGGGLFADDADTHNGEHALNTLLGASSRLQLKTAGATIDVDRKGINKIKNTQS
ncbi:MAG: hypothetical protein AAGC72_00450 [Planctomycetota bacterium]